MLDQSFSSENLRKILDWENRKGIYLEGRFYPKIAKITEKIKKCNSEIKEKQKKLKPAQWEKFKNKKNIEKEKYRVKKEDAINTELEALSARIADENFKVQLNMVQVKGKPVYTADKSAESYFALKQVQFNINKLYKVKQANRYLIVNQIKNLLADNFSKYIIKTDLSDFYESIPLDRLLKKISGDNLLSSRSKRIIFQTIAEYRNLSGSNKGIPRGVGISAYLAELFMRDVDVELMALQGVTYYARYVDDIIIVFTPQDPNRTSQYQDNVEKIIVKNGLTLNPTKTKPIDLVNGNSYDFDYLGYGFSNDGDKVKITLSQKKIDKYKRRMDLTFDDYFNYSKVNNKKAAKILVKRLRFLTGNFRLLNNKRNILGGFYFSNSLLTDNTSISDLDKYLTGKIKVLIGSTHYKNRLSSISFSDGFWKRRFSCFSTTDDLPLLVEPPVV